ncbi:MAG TPA: hypothetical protein VFJ82_27080 [Longimicrobium sp.]|nr:hypothetical protein [Longimicrobium sp.]
MLGEQYLITLLGAAIVHIYRQDHIESAAPFLRQILPRRSAAFYHRADAVLATVSGSLVGFIVFAPQSPLQCLAAGFGWMGAMNVLRHRTQGEER